MKSDFLRRYPALGFLLASALLALILPSGLRVAMTGPSELAELGPVPGDSDLASDLSELSAASGKGPGSGTGGAGQPTPGLSKRVEQPRPSLKRCVGKPPRQTEDTLSPPCVAFFEGDNGGATAKGVTADEITIVVHAGVATSTSYPAGFEDWNQPASPADQLRTMSGRAFVRHFNERYQFYGRKLRVWGFNGRGSDQAAVRADIEQIINEKNPFAILGFDYDTVNAIAAEASRRGVLAASYSAYERSRYQSGAPFLMSYSPDLEDEADHAVTYICVKLKGRTARHAPDPVIASQTRKFGIVYSGDKGPALIALKDLIATGLQKRCGITTTIAEANAGAANYAVASAAMRDAGVTTVIDVQQSGGSAVLSQQAASQGYLPEFFIPGGGGSDLGADTTSSGYTHDPRSWRGAFGFTFDRRRDARESQDFYRAHQEGCPDCTQFVGGASRMYDQMFLIFYAIQAAGPRLTAASVDKGMHAIEARGSSDPYKPSAYFSPGNYSFIKDAMEIWWDPTGQAPSGNQAGCYRLANQGARRRANEWAGDDTSVFNPADPCQGQKDRGVGG